MARVRERRRRALVDELLPKLRRLNPNSSDEEILDTAEGMAEFRLLAAEAEGSARSCADPYRPARRARQTHRPDSVPLSILTLDVAGTREAERLR